MKYRNIIILICIIIVLLLTVIITGKRPQAKPIISIADIRTIIIQRPSDTTEIEIKDNGFRLVRPISYPGDSSTISFLLNNLKNLKLGEVISQRVEKFNDYGVGDSGIKVILKGKKEIAFYIGRYAGDYQNSYFRFDKEKKVYLVKGLARYQIDYKPDDWRDKRILKIDRNLIERIMIDDKEIVKKDTIWTCGEQVIEKSKIDGILHLLSDLRATGFSDTSTFVVKNRIKILTTSGEFILEIGDKRDYSYLVKMPEKPTIFLLSEYTVNNFLNLIPGKEEKKKK
jgi:hypothetical protein|uniref:DUF4340 domain-containing protein n=1 Tax=candidate division WOR-3 bacterium TaxID=2052148 RepID=A0A7V3VTS9_UNCW3